MQWARYFSLFRQANFWIGLLVLALGMVFIGQLYPEVLTAPGDYLLNDQGEGIRNYFTYVWSARGGTPWLHSEAFQYPFGEHVVYTDGQPALSGLLRLWPGGAGGTTAVAVMNLLLLGSVPIGAWFLYRTGVRLGFHPALAAGFGLGLALLCPQASRLPWFYGLGYHFILPFLAWALVRRQQSQRRWLWSLILVGAAFLAGGLHPYWWEMTCLVMLLLALVEGSRHRNWKRLGTDLLVAMAPVLLALVIMRLTDGHADRNPRPWGFYQFNASIETLLLPFQTEGTPYQIFNPRAEDLGMYNWAGRGFLGTVGVLGLLGVLAVRWRDWSLRVEGKLGGKPLEAGRKWTRNFFVAAACLLPLAFAWPFVWDGSGELLEVFPVLHQFRHTGRLVWPFYFATGLLVLGEVDAGIKRWGGEKWKPWAVPVAVALLVAGIYAWEGALNHAGQSESPPTNVFSRTHLASDSNFVALDSALLEMENQAEGFQALVPLPWYHRGTEALYPGSRINFKVYIWTMAMAYHTRLPLTSAYLPRSSLADARKAFLFFDPTTDPAPLSSAFPSEQPLLLVVFKELPLAQPEEDVLNRAELIYENSSLGLYRLTWDQAWERTLPPSRELVWETARSRLIDRGDHFTSDSTAYVFRRGYDDQASDLKLIGPGAASGEFQDTTVLVDFSELAPHWEEGQSYELSFWYYHAENRTANRLLRLQKWEAVHRERIYYSYRVRGEWTRCQMEFTASTFYDSTRLVWVGEDYAQQIYWDELLVRPAGVDVYVPLFEGDSLDQLVVNNFPF